MDSLTVVIITLNEEKNIVDCIRSAKLVSDDIVVVDAGSTDKTVALADFHGARTFVVEWKCYGHSRNFGAAKAKHSWILALDADERVSRPMAESIRKLKNPEGGIQFRFRRRNYIGHRQLRFGTPGFEKVTRLYHRDHARWDLTKVHEKLVAPSGIRQVLAGPLVHFGLKDYDDYTGRSELYAEMSAEKYKEEGKRVTLFKRYASPLFNATKSYVFQLGFLDGKKGWFVAMTIARYSWMKYDYLREMLRSTQPEKIKASLKTAESV